MTYRFNMRMCFQDVDGEGIVYHSHYLDYAERARTEWLSELDLTNQDIIKSGVVFVLRQVSMDFLSPVRLDDIISVSVRIIEMKNASIRLEQVVSVGDEEKVKINLLIAFVDAVTLRPKRIPRNIKEVFTKYIENQGEE